MVTLRQVYHATRQVMLSCLTCLYSVQCDQNHSLLLLFFKAFNGTILPLEVLPPNSSKGNEAKKEGKVERYSGGGILCAQFIININNMNNRRSEAFSSFVFSSFSFISYAV
uniref:Uncharacterized protein n=1 Tax=Cacopsylla melanoneura TaxID=428564 RepID=A0A8D8M4S6_9HEMI